MKRIIFIISAIILLTGLGGTIIAIFCPDLKTIKNILKK